MMEISVPNVTSALLSFDRLSTDHLNFPTSLKKIQDLNTDCKTTNVSQPTRNFVETSHDKLHFLNHWEVGAGDNIMEVKHMAD